MKTLVSCLLFAIVAYETRANQAPVDIALSALQAYVKAGNTGAGDRFGQSVAVSGDTAVVGAAGEDSGTTGVNSIPNDGATDSGAAYFFAGLGTASGSGSIAENNAPNSVVGTLLAVDADSGDTHTYTLVSGTGATDNAAFTITGNIFTLNASADYETKNSYSIRVRATDAGGLFFEKVIIVTVLPGTRYSQWQLAEFGVNAGNPAIAGELADPDHDGLCNLLEYATRTNPSAWSASPFTTPVPIPGPAMQMSFPYRAAATDLRCIVQRSANLSLWTEIYRYDLSTGQIIEQSNITADENATTQVITVRDVGYSGATMFWRVLVEQP